MNERLAVYLYGERCGTISGRTDRRYDFEYVDEWTANDGPNISLCLQQVVTPFPEQHTRAYFGGLLPEGRARHSIAEETGIDELDDIALLRLLGRECAGAITIVPEGEPAHDSNINSDVRWLNDHELREILETMRIPGSENVLDTYSVSLAGAQRKRGLVVDEEHDRVGVPEGNELSTHIVKLAPENYPGLVESEHCMQQLARDIGLRASLTSVRRVEGEPVLQVERYDRHAESDDSVTRRHQEDMCQALGRLSSHKYERFDGTTAVGPTIAQIVQLIRTTASPSIQQVDDFMRLVWFNVIIGNVDAHAKNYSILYSPDVRSYAIAPLYDSICVSAFHAHNEQAVRTAEEPLVMNIGGQTRFWQLTTENINGLATQLAIQPRFLKRQIRKMVEHVDAAIDKRIAVSQSDPVTSHDILDVAQIEIHKRCTFLAKLLR